METQPETSPQIAPIERSALLTLMNAAGLYADTLEDSGDYPDAVEGIDTALVKASEALLAGSRFDAAAKVW